MRKKCYFVIILIFLVAVVSSFNITFADEIKREDGLSVHLIPKRVADLDVSGKVKWGFMTSQTYDLKPPSERSTFQTPNQLVNYLKTLSQKIQKNGIWMVVTNPDSYSAEEKSLIERLKDLCKKENIPLFICRGAELPNGWKRTE